MNLRSKLFLIDFYFVLWKFFSSKEGHENNEHQNRNEYDRIQRDLNDELQATQNELKATQEELQQARVQLDTHRKSKPKYDQVDEDNQR